MTDEYSPPFSITAKVIALTAEIGEKIGRIGNVSELTVSRKTRHDNRLRSIHSSLAIENNSLTLGQVSDIINGIRVYGPIQDIKEVKNAHEAYNRMPEFDPYKTKDLLTAHGLISAGLIKDSGRFRSSGVGIFAGETLIHMAPPAKLVPKLIGDLFDWVKVTDVHPLVKSCIFHYEFEFIHPFSDGNGRTGRLWHTILLRKWKPVFEWVPIESMIYRHQNEYYEAIGESTNKTDAGIFVEFMLGIINEALDEFMTAQDTAHDADPESARINGLIKCLGNEDLSFAEMMSRLELSHRTSFRENYLN
ncbi:MAG: Fic family protein, partial [Candidatus Methanoplasma sp.]|nr:Fic family protein [Candidatus Methanoplasma sp.]